MKGRKHKATGGTAEYEEDLKTKPERYDEGKPEDEAEERKHGGPAKRKKRKAGGVVHHEKAEELKHAKHVGKVEGERDEARADRKPRKSGGRTGCDSSPLSSAHSGTLPSHHKDARID